MIFLKRNYAMCFFGWSISVIFYRADVLDKKVNAILTVNAINKLSNCHR